MRLHPPHSTRVGRQDVRHGHPRALRAALLAGVLVFSACDWVSLAANALTYRTLQRGEVGNLVATDSIVYATAGEVGLLVLDSRSGSVVDTIAPPPGTESIDDVAIDGDLLFVLDARAPGHVAILSLEDPWHPAVVSSSQPAPVGPFSGVSAANGICVVSGGTSNLTVWRYDTSGVITRPVTTADLGRGQPDVVVSPNAQFLFVSTHYQGPSFGLDIVHYDSTARTLTTLHELKLDGAGFTQGGAKPANFPLTSALLGPDTLLVAFARGLAVVDISSPSLPKVLETLDLGGKAVSVVVRERSVAAAIAVPEPSVVLLEASVPPLRIVRRVPLPAGTFPGGIAFTGTRMAVAARQRGVLLLDR